MTTQTIEKIQTGLTANYVEYFTLVQGLKEAMQNIAYGAIKSGKKAKLYFDKEANLWAIKDKYTGFEKKHLYIGESEQRNDAEGLGTFGEGWKIFLLVMARNQIHHQVDTVGFSFWGSMEPTPHDTEVLVINVKDNDQTSGTRVYAEVEEELWRKATESFAVLQGIEVEKTKENTFFEDRGGELWVQGVRIENEETTNPLNLYHSYNLTQRDLINRDRSHADTEKAYHQIKNIVFNFPEAILKDFILLALEGNMSEDIQRGPYVPVAGSNQKNLWLELLAETHDTNSDKLLVPSYNQAVNKKAEKKGYTMLRTPRKWDYEITYLGIKKADDVIDDQYDIVITSSVGTTREEKTAFSKMKAKMKRVFKLGSVDTLPQFQYVESIKHPVNGMEKYAQYDKSTNVVYIATSIMGNEVELFDAVLPELIEWKYPEESTDVIYPKLLKNVIF